ncbi:MAG: phosphatase PAP2 family protein, partial [Bacteroidota bacterium]|nr:phosphatase PAP2 family protein [Bacteroidota bacterium]
QHRGDLGTRFDHDVIGSIGDVTEWHDVPVFLLFLARNSYKADNPSTKLLSLPPLPFERELASGIASSHDGGLSPGSMDSWLLPNTVFAVHLLYAMGHTVSGESDMRDEYAHAWGFYKVLIYNHVATELIKNTVSRQRPDDSDAKSFFSGHTSSAFVASAFLYRETADALDDWDALHDRPLLRTGLKYASFGVLYGWAAFVGYSRIADNKHYITDVLVGATVGTLIGNLLYGQYFSRGDGTDLPDIGIGMVDTQPAVSLSLTF